MKTRTWHCQNRSQKCNANLNTQVKIIRALRQSCLEQTKHAPGAMKTQSGPLGPQSRNARPPHAAPYWSARLITGSAEMSSSACVWLHTNTTSWHSKQQGSLCWVLAHTRTPRLLPLRFNQPPESAQLRSTSPTVSEVSGCLCTLRFKGEILHSFLLK